MRFVKFSFAFLILGVLLHHTAAMTLPLALTFVMVASVWPIYRGRRNLWGAALATSVLCLVLAALGAFIVWVGHYTVTESPQVMERVSELLPQDQTNSSAKELGTFLLGVLGSLIPALGLALLLFLDLPRLLRVADERLSGHSKTEPLKEWARKTARMTSRYWVARTVAGGLSGLLVGLGCLLLDIRLALLWASVNFLFNYIPTLGSVAASVLPAAFALAYSGPEKAVLALLVVGGVQLFMGNVLDPYIQDQFLPLSAFAVLLAVVAWGWVWGPLGALIGVPLTEALVGLACVFGFRLPSQLLRNREGKN